MVLTVFVSIYGCLIALLWSLDLFILLTHFFYTFNLKNSDLCVFLSVHTGFCLPAVLELSKIKEEATSIDELICLRT